MSDKEIAAVVTGIVFGYVIIAGFVKALLYKYHPNWDETDSAVAGAFWPMIAPWFLGVVIAILPAKIWAAHRSGKALPEARVHK